MIGIASCHELEKSDSRSSLVEKLYEENQFPEVTDLPWMELRRGASNILSNPELTRPIDVLEIANSWSFRADLGICGNKYWMHACRQFDHLEFLDAALVWRDR